MCHLDSIDETLRGNILAMTTDSPGIKEVSITWAWLHKSDLRGDGRRLVCISLSGQYLKMPFALADLISLLLLKFATVLALFLTLFVECTCCFQFEAEFALLSGSIGAEFFTKLEAFLDKEVVLCLK